MTTSEERISKIEGVQEQINERLRAAERQLERLERRQGGQFRWILGLILGMSIATVLGAVLGVLLTR